MDAFKLVGPGYYNHRPGFEGTKTKVAFIYYALI